MTQNSLIFLDCELFIENGQIEFKNFRKFGDETIFQNYQKAVMPKRYLISNIFTQFHNVADSSSNDFYLREGLNRVKNIFLRNQYPKFLLDQKMKLFLYDKKPEKPKIDATLSLKYTCANTETFCKNLIQQMKNVLPNFNVNVALKTVKVSQLFSRSAKAQNLCVFDTPECIYQFICDCKVDYIGMSLRPLHHRIHEHGQSGRGGEVFEHKTNCQFFKKSLAKIKRENSYQYLKPAQKDRLVYEHLQSHFKILTKNMNNYFERIDTEAFFIKTQRPSLNIQKDENHFALYSKMGFKNKIRKP